MKYLAILGVMAALLSSCGSNPSTGTAATVAVVPTAVPDLPDTPVPMPIPTDVPVAPTEVAALPTSAPAATPLTVPTLAGVAAQGSDCPADHPVKGNIVDRGANKGDKIYHLPGDNGYAQTKPERCFIDIAEAEAASYRAVKK